MTPVSGHFTQGPSPASSLPPQLPYPDGWFAVAFTAELPVGTVLTRPLQGEDVVLYRLRDGRIRAVRPHCPHLGAHLGRATVEGDDLVCPFHRFAFGPDGTCTRTSYGTPPPAATVTQHAVREVNDTVFVWRHHAGRPPLWELPEWHMLGDLPSHCDTWEMPGHAQDAVENAVDFGHFTALHRWNDSQQGVPVDFDGGAFRLSMRTRERVPLLGEVDLEVDVEACGLSRLHVCTRMPRMGLRTCAMIAPTMIAPSRFQIRQTIRIAAAEPARLPAPLARWVSRTGARLLRGPAIRANAAFVAEDFPIWDTKRYVSPPRLAQGDGPIGPFRRWTRQFYPPDAPAVPAPAPTPVPEPVPAESEVTA